jgi:hypothetical protein
VGATEDATDDDAADDAGALVGSGVGEAHAASTSANAINENKTIFFISSPPENLEFSILDCRLKHAIPNHLVAF